MNIQEKKKESILRYFFNPIEAMKGNCLVEKWTKKINTESNADGHPVIIISGGGMKGKRSLNLLNRFLKKNGYNSRIVKLAKEVGEAKNFNRLSKEVEQLHQETDELVTLIGWSLGGIYARLLAQKNSENVRQLITLSAPFYGMNTLDNATWWFKLVYEGAKMKNLDPRILANLRKKVSVPSTAFYSKDDEIVAWKSCIEKEEDELHQNIEMSGSHLDIILKEETLMIILDRLKHEESNWKKFKRVKWLPPTFGKVN